MLPWLDTIAAYPLISKIGTALMILAAGVLIHRILASVLSKWLEKTRMEKAAYSLVLSLAKVAVYLLVGLSAASALGIDVTGIVALASVLTLALSLALQNMVSNVIGGFTILYTAPFHSGDYVEIAGQGGTVTEINMTYTMLATPDNKVISIPNSAVVAAQIVNYSTMPTRRVEVNVTVSAAASADQVIGALLEAGDVEKILSDPAPFAAVKEYRGGAISYTLRLWVSNADYWDVYFLVNKRVKETLERHGIEMNYPHINVHTDK
jgi:small conductance mechanosensitive channel